MRTKRLIAMLLTLVMLLQAVPFAAVPKDFSDFPEKGNWAYDAMEAALENGLLHGKGDGIIAPSANLTRAEFAAVVTRAFGATKTKDVSFLTDVKAGDWFYEDNSVSKAYQMEVMNGTSDTTFHPLDSMRREDVFLTLARALFVEGTDEEVLSKFTDKAKIDKWAKNAFIGMVDEEYVNGYYNEEDEEWTLKPRASITRAELAQVFHNLFKYYISSYDVTEENKGVFGGKSKDEKKVYDGSLVVRTPGVTLQNAVINGDLVIADGVGEDKFTLINTDVKGSIIIRGGEGKVGTTESATVRNVDFINFTVDGKVIVNNVNGTVNFHNYKSDFKNGVVEHTPATYLPTATGGGGGGGGVTKYTYYVRHFLEPLEDGAEYIHNSDDDFKASVSKNTVVYPLRDAESFYGFEIDEEHENYEAYADGVKINAKDMTFDVYFKRSTFKVELGGKDENGNDFDDLEIKYEDVLTQDDLPDSAYEEEGEKFVGWSEEDDGTVDDEITITENTTLYPVYTYTVKFVPYNAAEVVKTDIPYNYVLTDMDVPADPTEVEAGKKYVGWSTTEDGSSGVVDTIVGVTITEPVTYYQVVVDKEAVEYFVDHYFQQLDGSYKTDANILDRQHFWERPGIEVTAIPATQGLEGFEYFAGHDEEELKGVVPEAEDGELVLRVYYNRLKYDVVIYDEDRREIDRVEDVMYGDTVDADELPSDEDMAKPGKVFEGWATKPDADADDVVDLDDLTIDKDTTALYPVYTDKEPVEYRVEYYFENAEDDGYTLDASYTVVDRETPDFEVEAELLTPDEIPDGFEYFEGHEEELLSAVQTEDGVTLKVFYKRLTFTVSFDVPGYAPKTYKYGETLKLEDIPEDNTVEVPDYKQFMGWATEPDKTAGTSRENLAGTEITDGIKFYPAFGDLGAVTYKKIYYFEELDGSYKAQEEEFSEIPGKTVTMDMLPVDEIPEGFEYYAHADEKTEGIVEEDGSLVLKVYYNRKTFTVSFDVPGYAPKTYKYGETLKLEDIPEDDTVEVPDYKQFMGWATEPDKTAGTSREDLAGTEITDGINFYPAFGDLGAVTYKKIYYFEELDGSYKAQEEILSGIPGNTVTMDKLAEADIPEGFEYYAHADEKTEGVITSGEVLELAVYYNRKTFTVSFDVPGYAPKTYKYGEALKLEDIPEDNTVEVPDYKQFMGWATEPDKTAGISREDLAGTEITDGISFYPAFGDLGAVTYKKIYYFEELDGSYKAQEEILSGIPGNTVTMDKLAEADIPEGFEYYAHADEKTEGVITSGEVLELAVYYNRKTFTVSFDVPGYAPKTYKYGETLKLEDIPEDDDVEVPDYKQFMGWATEPDKTAGTLREDLAGTEITDGISFYPAFGDLGAVTYKKIYYFEELDGSYKAQEEILSGVPGKTVTMDKLAEADIPEGFEYYAHADEKTEGVVEEDGSLVLKVYYNRKTFTVKFGEISEETYKYGYELVLSDIPEDDEVEVADDMKFMGWSTQEDATEGVAREELVGTVVEGELVYYPVIIPKDMVTYYVEHYFEALELNDDGTVKYELYECEELNGKIGTSVRAEFLEEEGFERVEHDEQILSGQIPKEEDEALVLKVYYGRKLLKVEFYDATGNFYDSDTQTYSEPSAVVEVRYGTKVDDAENLEKYAQAEVEYKKNRFKLKRGTEKGFWREPEFGNAYNTLGGRVYHTIPLYWWYEDAESGEFEKFYVEGTDNELVFTEEVTEVYTKAKMVEVRLMMDDFKYEGYFYAYYDDETRLLDTVKDVLFVNAASITDAVNITGAEDKAYEELAEKGLFHYVDGEYEITNVNKFVRFARLMGEKNFEEFLDSFINQDAVTSVEDFLFDYLTTHDTDESAVHLKELVDNLVVDHKDIARDMIGEIAVDLIEKEVTYVEEFFMTYTSSLVEADDTDDLEEMIADMFKEYKKTNEDQFVGFVTDVVVKALSEDTPNKDVVKMIEDYIKSEIKKGTFDAEIVNYIMSMSDDDFKSAATSVIKEDVSIIENDVNEKLLSDDSFVETIIDEIFALESDTVDKEIKKYIKDYNLADNYIMNNPEVIVDYISDEQIGEIWGSYMPGVAITRQEKIDAVTQYIADNPDTAVDTLKGYAGKDLDKVVNDYYDNHRDDVKGAVYTEVLSNFSLRTELASFAMSLIKDDEFSDLLDFAIDDYLGEVLADEDKKRELAETEVDRLSNEKIYELDFVQDAIDTVVDDVIADIQANENDGDENTESVYIANVKAYAKSLNDFSDIVSAFITADEDFRNEIIVNLFDNLYASDPEHKIILQFMEKITDKMIDEGDIDVNILVTIIDYIKESGEHGHTLTRDIIDGLMKLGDELVSYVEAHLGWADESGKLEASLKFRRQATYEEEFEVNADNLFIMELVDEKVRSMTFEAFMNEYVYPRLPDKVPDSIFDKLPMEIIENLYNNAINEFLFDLEEAIRKAEENGESSMVGSGVVIRVNPVDDLADPLYDWVMDGYDKANAKAESLGGRIGEIYLSYYRDNPYIEDIINLSDIYNYLDGEGRPAEEPSSGYSISSFEDVYYNVVMPGAVLSDDLFVWYLNKIDFGKIRGLAEDNEDLILAMYNHPNVLMERYAQEGLPDTMSDYYEDLMEDPDIKAAFKKIDNKVSFEMEPFVMRFLTNSTAEMYYYKALEKFGMKADEILDKYEGASVKKEITHENFTDLLDEIQYCWEDGNANATTDYVLDGGLKELFSIVSIEKSFRGYTVSFERKFADR